MNSLFSFGVACALLISGLISSSAHAAVTSFSNRTDWQNAAGSPQTIDFSTTDAGTPITDPPSYAHFDSLTLKGVTFLDANLYYNSYLYIFPSAVMHVTLPANTLSFGVDLSPIYQSPGTYTIKLSTGEVFNPPAMAVPSTVDFFGVTSSAPIAWVEISLDSTYLNMDNFSFAGISVQQIPIDIVPGSTINPVYPKDGEVEVAILSTATFDARTVNPTSVRFGLNGTEAPAKEYTFKDVNRDGRKDMVLEFKSRNTGIPCGATLAKLTAKTTTGQQLAGSDRIKTVGCRP